MNYESIMKFQWFSETGIIGKLIACFTVKGLAK